MIIHYARMQGVRYEEEFQLHPHDCSLVRREVAEEFSAYLEYKHAVQQITQQHQHQQAFEF